MIEILVIALIILIVWGIGIFNRLIKERNLVKEAWSGIDVQLKRRYDLIPNIVQTVKGYMQYEQKLFEEIASLRSRGMQTEGIKEKGKTENAISRSLKTIFAVAEGYPELKANQGFLELQKTLSSVEDEIQLSRRYYNGSVRNYNTTIESFPNLILANMFNFETRDFFEMEYATERQAPDVKL